MQITLNDGRVIPQLGLGLWKTPAEDAADIVVAALQTGYRHLDTAAVYGNEAGVGQGLAASGVARADAFVTTKVWNDAQGYDSTLRAARESLARLRLDYVDLYLVHWPAPRRGLYVETWRAMIALREQGLAKSIGVSNFGAEHLERIIGETGVTPAINQIELHPRFQQRPLRAVHARHAIATQSWAPLGRSQALDDPLIQKLAAKHRRTPAQIVIRWHLDEGLIAIPKTARRERLAENFDVFGFALDREDRDAIAALDRADGRIGPDPMTAAF
ncbi:MAG: aldo/keto reductase [Pseudomonadota bacterium]|nr:aldo/keto reductase [Pseudomonadota bacterium]